jgi:hypothetical protein
LWLVAGGGVLAVIGLVVMIRHRRFLARAKHTSGKVTGVVASGSSEFPVVEFESPDGAITFRSSSGSPHRVGDTVPVAYDPEKPTRAVIDTHALIWVSRLFVAMGIVIAVMGVVFNLVFPGLERSVAARDVAIDSFLAVFRSKGADAARATMAHDAKLDEAYLRAHVPASTKFESQSYAHSSDSACVSGALLPSKTRLVFDMVVENGTWKVRGAGLEDPCESRLD